MNAIAIANLIYLSLNLVFSALISSLVLLIIIFFKPQKSFS